MTKDKYGNNDLMNFIKNMKKINYTEIKKLLEKNDINDTNKKGDNILFILFESNIDYKNIVKLIHMFIQYGVDFDHINKKKDTIFDRVFDINIKQSETLEILKIITSHQKTHALNFDIFCNRLYNGWTPSSVKLMECIVENMLGTLTKKKYSELYTCYLSTQYNSDCKLDIVKYFVSKGADVNYDSNKNNVLEYLLLGDRGTGEINIEIVKYLLEQNINVNSINKYGNSILVEFIKNNFLDDDKTFYKITKLLINYGAKINKKIKIPLVLKELFK